MRTACDEGDVLTRSGQFRAKVTACTTCAVDRNTHRRPFSDIAAREFVTKIISKQGRELVRNSRFAATTSMDLAFTPTGLEDT